MLNQLLIVLAVALCIYYVQKTSACNPGLKPIEQVCVNGTCYNYSLLLGYWCDGENVEKLQNANVDSCKAACAKADCTAMSVEFRDAAHPTCEVIIGKPTKSLQLYTACYVKEP
uniref:Apple domain-containing protein n=1 Tax=Ascaris lumbricoides TaxID=6252 RepID=A0A0M3IFI6_ASCLU